MIWWVLGGLGCFGFLVWKWPNVFGTIVCCVLDGAADAFDSDDD